MQKHPCDAELIRASLEDSNEPVGEATRAHLEAGCDRCRRRLSELHSVIAALAAPPLEEVPAAWTERAAAWLAAQTAAKQPARRLKQVLEDVRAVLVLDTLPGALLEGIRGTVSAGGRRMLYDSPVGSLHLQIDASSVERVAVLGQFLPSETDSEPVRGRAIMIGTEKSETCPLSENGEFHFAGLSMDAINLQIIWGNRRILVDPIDMSSQ